MGTGPWNGGSRTPFHDCRCCCFLCVLAKEQLDCYITNKNCVLFGWIYNWQLCQQILLPHPCGGPWPMLWITATNGRAWKESFRRLNRLTPNDPYMGRTAPLTSKRCILYIYSTNTTTEYFKHALYSPFLSLQNAVSFIMLTCLVLVLFTFYIQSVLKLKKK